MSELQDLDTAVDTDTDIEASKAAGPSSSGRAKECRICLTTDNQHDVVEPCTCTGTVQYAHLECLRTWCVNNLSLKCEICGSVYKDSVVESLMGTLIEAQDRQVADQGLSDEEGIRLDVLDAAARERDAAHPNAAANGQPMEPEAQQRMQEFLEELLQLYASRSEAMVARANSAAFQAEPEVQARPHNTTAAYTCAAALLLLWMLLFVILSRLFTQDYVRTAVVAAGSLVLLSFACWYFKGRCIKLSHREAHDVPFGRRAREYERERQFHHMQQTMNAPVIRIIR